MNDARLDVIERRAPFAAQLLFVIGPGAAGKSTLGQHLAPLLGRVSVDLDEIFIARLGDIGAYIGREGYSAYKDANSRLAKALVDEMDAPLLLVTSSGFVTTDNPPEALARNRSLLARGYSLCLLPSFDLEEAVRIIVARQLSRPFARDPAREEATIRERFPLYARTGDMVVAHRGAPDHAARAVARRLCGSAMRAI